MVFEDCEIDMGSSSVGVLPNTWEPRLCESLVGAMALMELSQKCKLRPPGTPVRLNRICRAFRRFHCNQSCCPLATVSTPTPLITLLYVLYPSSSLTRQCYPEPHPAHTIQLMMVAKLQHFLVCLEDAQHKLRLVLNDCYVCPIPVSPHLQSLRAFGQEDATLQTVRQTQ